MAGSLNKVTLIGFLGKDPDIRNAQDGSKIANLSIATSESWKDKNSGERKEKTEWHKVVIFNEILGGVAEKYLKKGSKVYLEGQLQTRKWTDQQGQEKYTTEIAIKGYEGKIILLDTKEESSKNSYSSAGYSSEPSYSTAKQIPLGQINRGEVKQMRGGSFSDDAVPF